MSEKFEPQIVTPGLDKDFRTSNPRSLDANTVREISRLLRADANAAPLGDTFRSGRLHGASIYNVYTFMADTIEALIPVYGRSPDETTGKSRSAYISDLTVRRLDSGYVVTWQEDGEPCGSETISEKLAYALVRADGGILGITDDSAVKAAPKRAYYETHDPPHCPTCGCGLPREDACSCGRVELKDGYVRATCADGSVHTKTGCNSPSKASGGRGQQAEQISSRAGASVGQPPRPLASDADGPDDIGDEE